MNDEWINCRECNTLPPELQEYASRTCGLCAPACDECLNEAGYCTPCDEEALYSKEDAIGV